MGSERRVSVYYVASSVGGRQRDRFGPTESKRGKRDEKRWQKAWGRHDVVSETTAKSSGEVLFNRKKKKKNERTNETPSCRRYSTSCTFSQGHFTPRLLRSLILSIIDRAGGPSSSREDRPLIVASQPALALRFDTPLASLRSIGPIGKRSRMCPPEADSEQWTEKREKPNVSHVCTRLYRRQNEKERFEVHHYIVSV